MNISNYLTFLRKFLPTQFWKSRYAYARVGHKHYANYGHGFMTGMGTNEVQLDLVHFLEAHPDFL